MPFCFEAESREEILSILQFKIYRLVISDYYLNSAQIEMSDLGMNQHLYHLSFINNERTCHDDLCRKYCLDYKRVFFKGTQEQKLWKKHM